MSRPALLLAPLVLLASAAQAGAGSSSSGLAVSAWPARVVVTAPGTTAIGVGNPGDEAVRVVARPQAYALDARGRPRIEPLGTKWFDVRPVRLLVPPHGTARLQVTVRRPHAAGPGDHAAVLLLATEPPPGRQVFARLRIGVVVVVRVPGRLTRHLALGALRNRSTLRRTRLELIVANRGNVDEWLSGSRISVTLVRNGWRLAARIEARRLLARSSGLVEVSLGRRLRGPIDALVLVRHPRPGVAFVRRRYRVEL